MRHEKIIKREDGSRVRIKIEFRAEWNSRDVVWDFSVDVCQKGKRTWIAPLHTDSYRYRGIPTKDRDKAIQDESLRRASKQEIESAMLELWQSIKPSL